MKILTAEQQRELDAYTIENEPISSVDLMERAAARCFDYIEALHSAKDRFSVICGPGNNGGDGLVVARYLTENNFDVQCYLIAFSTSFSDDFSINKERLESKGLELEYIESEDELSQIHLEDRIVIDAIFGTGLSRPAEGFVKEAISYINENASKIISVDMPSGMYCDDLHEEEDVMINAHLTITFQAPKLNFFFPETGNKVGEWHVLDIGLDQNKADSFSTNHFCLTQKMAAELINKRKIFSHKGTYGHARIISGSYGKMGACVLAAKAALRAGAGLVSAVVPKCGMDILQQTIPPAMVEANEGEYLLSGKFTQEEDTVYGIGPGIGKEKETVSFLESFLEQLKNPAVFDADALNIISENKYLLNKIPEDSILTPHPKEFERLVGSFSDSYERLQKQKDFSEKHKVVVVFKDARTIISSPSGECYFSPFGNSGMATGGSGDVLTGIITGLLAQKYEPFQAAKLGVALHGIAGNIAIKETSEYALISEDITEFLGKAFLKVLQK